MHMQRETEFMRAASNKKEFPKWDILADTIDTLRNQAAQRGLVLAPKDAYEWAMGAAYDKVKAVDEASTAASARAQDATSHGLFAPSAHTRINFDDKVITSAADIAKLSDAEADTLFDKLGNTPF
jgi:hypothetical protein